MNKIQRMFHSLMVSIIFFTPGNALALSDIDTTFSIQQNGQDKKTSCDFLTITNGNLNCTDGAILVQIPISSMKQLAIMYMGKEFKVSKLNENDIKSLNTMSMNKEQAISEKKALVAQERKKIEAKESAVNTNHVSSEKTNLVAQDREKAPETEEQESKRIALCKEVASAAKTIMETRRDSNV